MKIWGTLIAILGLLAWGRPALGCSCRAATLEQQARRAPVVLVADVLEARGADGAYVARAQVVEGLRGAKVGDEVEIPWVPNGGRACFFVSLRPGRWLLFLGRDDQGRLSTLRCDGHSALLQGAAGERKLAAVRAALTAGASRDDAVARALPVANQALDAAYGRDRGPGLVRPPHQGAWVEARDATVQPSGTGWRVSWARHRPAGFEWEVEVEVPPVGAPRATRARATFSPD